MATRLVGVDESLKQVNFSSAAGNRCSGLLFNEEEDGKKVGSSYLVNLGQLVLPFHPMRIRYLPYTKHRIVLYGQKGYQEFSLARSSPDIYVLKRYSWEVQMCDCVQTSDLYLYTIARSHDSAVISCYDEHMNRQNYVEVDYPMGCLSSLATDHECNYLYGTNPELNCLVRFTADDLVLHRAEQFGNCSWRPFDCCVSQQFTAPDGMKSQYLFVSNLDAGTFVFDLGSMDIVEVADDDLSPGAKYLTYEPSRSLLFVSSSYDCLLRIHRFDPQGPEGRPCLKKTGDFYVASRKSKIRSSGSQCVMWDPTEDHLAVASWSRSRFQFLTKVYRVYLDAGGDWAQRKDAAASALMADSESVDSLLSLPESQ